MIKKIISVYIRYKLVKMFLKDTLHTDFEDDAIFIQSVVIFILTGKYQYGNLQEPNSKCPRATLRLSNSLLSIEGNITGTENLITV